MNNKSQYQSIINRFQKQKQKMEWKTISYAKHNQNIPSERWGHRFVNIQSNELVVFGGFGGSSCEGKYMSDIWSFCLTSYTWKLIPTSGRIPQSRSNYTVHYNIVNDQIIMFGGGSNNKVRYNDVNILNWKTKQWRRYVPEQSSQPIWERTYHCSQFSYPYLIVHGGEGVSNIDLDDMWVFNVITKKWASLEFQQKNKIKKRRFHTSALIDGYFYIIGGCTGNYQLLGDIYRVNLNNLLEKNQLTHFRWECVLTKNKLVERWGHSTDVYNGIIYISCGRISSEADSNETLRFDPISKQIVKLQIDKEKGPTGRRKHASSIIGNSLLIFGGYNGNYLNDFCYVALKEIPQSSRIRPILVQNQKLIETLSESQQKYQSDLTIELVRQGKSVYTLNSNRQKLANNKFMIQMLKYSVGDRLTIDLPSFCSVNMFRLINLSIIEGELLLMESPIQYYRGFIASNQYFLCQLQIDAIENYLLSKTNQENYREMLQLSKQCSLNHLELTASQLYLLNHNQNNHQSPQQFTQSRICSQKQNGNKNRLCNVYNVIRFDIGQRRLAESNLGFFSKTLKTIKQIMNKKDHSIVINKRQQQKGCFQRFTTFVNKIFNKQKSKQNQHQERLSH